MATTKCAKKGAMQDDVDRIRYAIEAGRKEGREQIIATLPEIPQPPAR